MLVHVRPVSFESWVSGLSGSDIKKRPRLYREKYPEVVHTYDITHGTAALLKSELSKDEAWKKFAAKAAACATRLQQTNLEFLRPMKQRKKARFMNLNSLVDWAYKVLKYQEAGDFHAINPSFVLLETAAESLLRDAKVNIRDIEPIIGRFYDSRADFAQALRKHLREDVSQDQINKCIAAASLGRARFEQELGWVKQFEMAIGDYRQIFEISNIVQKRIKTRGLNQFTYQDVRKELLEIEGLHKRVKEFASRLLEFVKSEGAKVRTSQTWLGSSDIIESLFGKYKYFAERSPQKTMGNLLLSLPLLTQGFNIDVIKKALETVGVKELYAWTKKSNSQFYP